MAKSMNDGRHSTEEPTSASSKRGHVTRRQFVGGLAGASLLTRVPNVFAQPAPVVFVTYGGSYGESVNKHLVKPFEKESGLTVKQGVSEALAAVKIQVQSKNVQFDLVELAGGDFLAGMRDDLFEPVDTSIVKLDKVPALAKHPNGIQYALFLSGMGYDRRKIPDAEAPKTWADAYDINRYKGMRALSKHISTTPTLENALLADGVPIDKLYPLDVDRALNSLKKLGKNIYWYENNQEPINFLQQQLGPIANVASGRVEIANRGGAGIGFVYNQLQLSGDYLTVPKGAKNKEGAFG
jgi:putative spermidine/putrescine transport system substrate-binding protein